MSESAGASTLKRVLDIGGRSKEHKLPPNYDGWKRLILDIEPGLDVDIIMDARDLKTHHGRYDAVYSSHTLEHIPPWHIDQVLEGVSHVLDYKAHFEIRVPNMLKAMAAAVKLGDLDVPMYMSGEGPISVRDLVWGYSYDIRACGHHFRHLNGFMPNDLTRILRPYFKSISIAEEGVELIAIARKELSDA